MTAFNAAFWKWFGDSKVVDERGKPLVVYHGTGRRFRSFDTSPKSTHTGNVTAVWGSFFTPSRGEAERYVHDFHGGQGRVIAAHLSIKNPAVISRGEWDKFAMMVFRRQATQERAEEVARKYRRELVGSGHDGIVVAGRGFNAEYVAFYPSQIKAVDNDGTWDADDPDIESNPPVGARHVGAVHSEDLPRDMQQLIMDMVPAEPDRRRLERGVTFAIWEVPTSWFPRVSLKMAGGDERGEGHALAMQGQQLSPVIVWKHFWYDGRHRVWLARKLGSPVVRYIDLAEAGLGRPDNYGVIGVVWRRELLEGAR